VQVLKRGCHPCDCPEAYGPPKTIYNRFVRWTRRDIWENLPRELAGSKRCTSPPFRIAVGSVSLRFGLDC